MSLTQIAKHEVNVITKIDIALEAIRASCLVAYKVHLIEEVISMHIRCPPNTLWNSSKYTMEFLQMFY
jgi:hypothetical protein